MSTRAAPARFSSPRAGIGGGAAGIDVVDEDDRAALQLGLAPLVDPEGAAHRLARARAGPCRAAIGVALTRSIRSSRASSPPRRASARRDQRRLVVAAPPDPPAVQRDRREQRRRRRRRDGAAMNRAMRLGDARPAAIFELQRHLPRDIAIGDRGAQPVIGGRLGQAARRIRTSAPRHNRTAARSARSRARRGRSAPTSSRGRNGAARRSIAPQPGQRGGSAKSRIGRKRVSRQCSGGVHGPRLAPRRLTAKPIPPISPAAARWRSGYAEDCKSLHAGSIPARASTQFDPSPP